MKTNKEKLIKKFQSIHGDLYDYSSVNYINYKTPIKITCKTCGNIFNQTPSNHGLGSGCPKCAKKYNENKKLDTPTFIKMAKEVHGELYSYSNTSYVNAKTKVSIKCKKCKTTFMQLPRGHVYVRSGCPHCKRSHGETRISQILKILQIDYNPQHRFEGCRGKAKPLPFDFYIPSLKTCIEFDGKQHYDKTSKFYSEEIIKNDKTKTKFCKDNDIRLIRLRNSDFDSIEKILKKWLNI